MDKTKGKCMSKREITYITIVILVFMTINMLAAVYGVYGVYDVMDAKSVFAVVQTCIFLGGVSAFYTI